MNSFLEYDPSRRLEYLSEFKRADRSFKKMMGWSGPRIKSYNEVEIQDYYQRVLAEAYDNSNIEFTDALIGYMLVLGGCEYDKTKMY